MIKSQAPCHDVHISFAPNLKVSRQCINARILPSIQPRRIEVVEPLTIPINNLLAPKRKFPATFTDSSDVVVRRFRKNEAFKKSCAGE
jgi:hypothetical protein